MYHRNYIAMFDVIRRTALSLLFCCSFLCAAAQGGARYHTVEEGQTLYSIARHYGISPSELQKLNPQAGDMIRPGDKLRLPDGAVPQSVAVGPGAQFVGGATPATQPQPAGYKTLYQIKKKDTLYRICLEHNVTIAALLAVNPGLTESSKLKKGEWLKIPYTQAELQAEAARQAEAAAKAEAAKKKSSKNHLNMAVVLPMKENTERGGKMVEFYQGLLMAADSVRKQGVSVDIYAYHSGNSVAELNTILDKEEMKHMDVIFGPLDGVQANVLSTFSRQNKVRLVMPFATTNTYGLDNPCAYVVSAQNDEVNRQGAAAVAKRFANSTYVVVNVGASDTRASSFIGHLAAQGITPKTVDLETDDALLRSLLSLTHNNIIILNSSAQSALQKAARRLRAFLGEHSEYKLSLLAYPEWTACQGTLLKDMHALDTYAFTPFYRNPNDARTLHFENRFKANFGHELIRTMPRYGTMGLDLGYYFLNGISRLGDYFDERQHTLGYQPLQNNVRFEQKGGAGAFLNVCVNLVHFSPLGRLEVVK